MNYDMIDMHKASPTEWSLLDPRKKGSLKTGARGKGPDPRAMVTGVDI